MSGHAGSFLKELLHVANLHAARIYNRLARSREAPPAGSDQAAFLEVLARARTPSDISDHLPTLFVEALSARPRLMVELGVRSGNSTFVLERVARLTGATLVSVDLADCSSLSDDPAWHFVRDDDVRFGERFRTWCSERGIEPGVDVLFVDTAHSFEHTRAELRVWLPHLSPHGRALFHDTNQRRRYRRRDGTVGISRRNRREVMAAIEERVGGRFDESRRFETVRGGFLIRHHPECNGLTVLERHPALTPGPG